MSTAEALKVPDLALSPVDRLHALVAADMASTDRAIHERLGSAVSLIPDLAKHLIDSGGKRLRPLLTLAAARMCGYAGDRHVRLAAAVEFIHTATLLHDDVVDASELRRGKLAANLVWGNKPSILVGDFLFSRAFQLMVETGRMDVLNILAGASAVIAEGEVLQLKSANNLKTTEEDYLRVIEAKTATLFSASAESGALLAGAPADQIAGLKAYGYNLGIAFQLVDDALDYSGDSASLGKSVGDDFREGKITLPVILCFRRGGERERAFWNRTLGEGRIEDDDLDQAIGLMKKHNAIEATLERARHYGAIARDALAIFPAERHARALTDVIGFCIGRAN
jgi:octaprenyl-diphosphate synthase